MLWLVVVSAVCVYLGWIVLMSYLDRRKFLRKMDALDESVKLAGQRARQRIADEYIRGVDARQRKRQE